MSSEQAKYKILPILWLQLCKIMYIYIYICSKTRKEHRRKTLEMLGWHNFKSILLDLPLFLLFSI